MTPAKPTPKPPRAVVLAVDDDDDALVLLQRVFQKYLPDVHLLTATDGAQALALLDKNKVDIVIADYKMPRMDGLEFLAQAHKKHQGFRSLMLTAYPDPGLAQRASDEAGVSLVIAKPFQTGIIAGAIDFMLENPE
jgi:response regulator RpfG family c-di-GMP phosphodiesterase